MNKTWPRPLKAADGPIRKEKVLGAADGMGDFGPETKKLVEEGFLPPDMMTGLTLFILGNQPRNPEKQSVPGAGGGVAGGVWVRERYTIIRALGIDEVFSVTGEAVGRHIHKGRRYGTNRCKTLNAAGDPAASNLTTGLLAYKVQEGLEETLEGEDPQTMDAPAPDWSRASLNPSLEALKALKTGDQIIAEPVLVSLGLMEARDTRKPDNPIHSDPELARKAGLKKPIAGGSHVQSFVVELILQKVGRHSLFYGANFDIRWKAPVYADLVIHPVVTVAQAADDHVVFNCEATLDSGATAMTGTVTVPIA